MEWPNVKFVSMNVLIFMIINILLIWKRALGLTMNPELLRVTLSRILM